MANGDFTQLAYSFSRVKNNPLSAKTSELRIPNISDTKHIFSEMVHQIYPEWFQRENEPEPEPLQTSEE